MKLHKIHKIDELILTDEIKAEYKKSMLLNIFKKIVSKMKKDSNFNLSVRTLYRQSPNSIFTTKALVLKHQDFELTEEEAELVTTWMNAFFKKADKRKGFTKEFKMQLYNKQSGLCASCGEPLGNELSQIHVDHIIPWTLVGDELNDNYQCLCSVCNECKSSHTDYIFKNLLNLN